MIEDQQFNYRHFLNHNRGFLLVIGESGAGKTHILKELAASEFGVQRSVFIDGLNIFKTTIAESERALFNSFQQAIKFSSQTKQLKSSQSNQILIIIDNIEWIAPYFLVSSSSNGEQKEEINDLQVQESKAQQTLAERCLTSLLCEKLDEIAQKNIQFEFGKDQIGSQKQNCYINIVASTRNISAVYPGLLIASRFQNFFRIDMSNLKYRQHLLNQMTSFFPFADLNEKDWQYSKQNIIERVAKLTSGYNAADLQSLCQSSIIVWRRRINEMNEVSFQQQEAVQNEKQQFTDMNLIQIERKSENKKIIIQDFLNAMEEVPPANLSQDTLFSRYRNMTDQYDFDIDLSSPQYELHPPSLFTYLKKYFFGIDDVLHSLERYLVQPITNAAKLLSLGIVFPCGILLHGPSGSGKTSLATSIAQIGHALGLWWVAHIESGAGLLGSEVGSTEKALGKLFIEARRWGPTLIVVDEADVLFPRRQNDRTTTRSFGRIASAFARELDICSREIENARDFFINLSELSKKDNILEDEQQNQEIKPIEELNQKIKKKNKRKKKIKDQITELKKHDSQPNFNISQQLIRPVMVLATTRSPEMIDASVTRAGRLCVQVAINPPNVEAQIQILINASSKMPLSLTKEDENSEKKDILQESWNEFFRQLINGELGDKEQSIHSQKYAWTAAQLKNLAREAAMCALRENLDAQSVEKRHFLQAAHDIQIKAMSSGK